MAQRHSAAINAARVEAIQAAIDAYDLRSAMALCERRDVSHNPVVKVRRRRPPPRAAAVGHGG
jgi:hypothetical protein